MTPYILACLAAYAGLGVATALLFAILWVMDRIRRRRSKDIYYIYATHMEKSTDVHRRRRK